jgi:lipid-A-disaccharide synthase
MADKKKIMLVCGEASGDLHASLLITSIQTLDPNISFSAVGGNLTRNTGAEIICDINELSVMGLFDVLKKLPRFFALKKLIFKKIEAFQPDLLILVDFSGFNLRLARAVNRKIPIIYYISPQVWASRSGRIKTIKEYITRMIVFFKFEEELYRKEGVPVHCIGHPLLDIVKPSMDKKQFRTQYNLTDSAKTIALLPGSRKQEIRHILPVMLETASRIKKSLPDTQFVIAKSPHVPLHEYLRHTQNFLDIRLLLVEGKTYDCIEHADFCIVASGTATLETAILKKPFIIVYKTGFLNYILYRPQIKVPFIGMVNIVAQEKIIPEFIQHEASARAMAEEAITVITDDERQRQYVKRLASFKDMLGAPGAGKRGAAVVVDFLNRAHS